MTPEQPKPMGYFEIANTLGVEIRQGKYPDLRLPTQAELCERFGVSRMTVANAIRLLQDRRMVYTVQGKGAFVRQHEILPPLTVRPALLDDLNDPKGTIVWAYFDSTEDAAALLGSLEIDHPRLDPIVFRALIHADTESFEAPQVRGLRIEVREAITPMQPLVRLTTGDVVMTFDEDRNLYGAHEVAWFKKDPVLIDVIREWLEAEWTYSDTN